VPVVYAWVNEPNEFQVGKHSSANSLFVSQIGRYVVVCILRNLLDVIFERADDTPSCSSLTCFEIASYASCHKMVVFLNNSLNLLPIRPMDAKTQVEYHTALDPVLCDCITTALVIKELDGKCFGSVLEVSVAIRHRYRF
jgi:hypothetical protein